MECKNAKIYAKGENKYKNLRKGKYPLFLKAVMNFFLRLRTSVIPPSLGLP